MSSELRKKIPGSRKKIPLSALKLFETLKKAGHTTYFVGGWVRDLLSQTPSDDIDLASSATPSEVEALFPKTIGLGKRFGSVAVLFPKERSKNKWQQFEVTTFREDGTYINGRSPEEITPSNPKEDAQRRDFTLNGLFYDPDSEEVIDYVGGLRDLEKGIIKTIGNPNERFGEDRLRMIRAVRYACRFNFPLDSKTQEAIVELSSSLIPSVSVERIWQELEKMNKYGSLIKGLKMMRELHLFSSILPELNSISIECSFPDFEAIFSSPLFPLLSLYPFNLPSSETIHLAWVKRLKLSNSLKKEVLLAHKLHTLFSKDPDGNLKVEWFYLILELNALNLSQCLPFVFDPKDQLNFQKILDLLTGEFKELIRIKTEKKQFLSSNDLKDLGCMPGPMLGELIRHSEKLAILHQLTNKKDLIEYINNDEYSKKLIEQSKR